MQLCGWMAQYIGYKFFERRSPALFEIILLTLNAPFFAIAQLFMLIGWRQEMFADCQSKIDQNIAEYWAEKNKKKHKPKLIQRDQLCQRIFLTN